MKCGNCGKENPSGMKFCVECGSELLSQASNTPSARANISNKPYTSTSKPFITKDGWLCLLIVLVCGFIAYFISNGVWPGHNYAHDAPPLCTYSWHDNENFISGFIASFIALVFFMKRYVTIFFCKKSIVILSLFPGIPLLFLGPVLFMINSCPTSWSFIPLAIGIIVGMGGGVIGEILCFGKTKDS